MSVSNLAALPDAPTSATPENLPEIFEYLPDIYFYVKDRQCRWKACNNASLSLFNARHKSEILGRSEIEFFPRQIAEPILRDDRHVMETGEKIINKMEVIVDENGQLVWVATTKLPTYAADGTIDGIMGITRIVRRTDMLPEGYRQYSRVIHFIQEHYGQAINIKDLASLSCLSESQFRKNFRRLFRMPPQEFILRVRMQAAARQLVSTDEAIVEIALRSSFCDQSYFTHKFTLFFGLSPKKYRDRWRGSLAAEPLADP